MAGRGHRQEDPLDRGDGYEKRDVGGRVLFAAAIALILLVGLLHVLTTGLYVVFTGEFPLVIGPTPTPLATPMVPPEPRLQVDPASEWQAVQATQESILGEYGWVDQDEGVARIPIDRAIEIITELGLPFSTPETPQGANGGAEE
jgi:hypothetical protein